MCDNTVIFITIYKHNTYNQQLDKSLLLTFRQHVSPVKQPSSGQSRTQSRYTECVHSAIDCTLSMYLHCVLLRPDDGCFTGETRCLKVNDKLLSSCWLYVLCFLDSNKYHCHVNWSIPTYLPPNIMVNQSGSSFSSWTYLDIFKVQITVPDRPKKQFRQVIFHGLPKSMTCWL